jgi:hypothetical protein
VAWDEPQVSVGGLLEKSFWNKVLGKILSTKEMRSIGALEKKEN